jgi:ABC-type sugar transport system ATPase subunit
MVGRLRVGQQQMAEIACALSLNARLIIMDEPPLALGAPHRPQLLRRSKRFSIVSKLSRGAGARRHFA